MKNSNGMDFLKEGIKDGMDVISEPRQDLG